MKVIEGKIPNALKVDGNLIEIKIFQYKKGDGDIVKAELSDIVKNSSQKLPIQEKQSFLSILKNKFGRKKLAAAPLKVPEKVSFEDKKGKKITLHSKKPKKREVKNHIAKTNNTVVITTVIRGKFSFHHPRTFFCFQFLLINC